VGKFSIRKGFVSLSDGTTWEQHSIEQQIERHRQKEVCGFHGSSQDRVHDIISSGERNDNTTVAAMIGIVFSAVLFSSETGHRSIEQKAEQ
jgi:hypothetical protein